MLRFHYHQQALGSVTEISQPTGAVVEWVTYDVYGAAMIRDRLGATVTSSAIGNPWLFTARAFDAESGLYHYRARAFDPSAGRFLQRDPLGLSVGLNLLRYVASRPTTLVDPLGLRPKEYYVYQKAMIDYEEARKEYETALMFFKGAQKEYPGEDYSEWDLYRVLLAAWAKLEATDKNYQDAADVWWRVRRDYYDQDTRDYEGAVPGPGTKPEPPPSAPSSGDNDEPDVEAPPGTGQPQPGSPGAPVAPRPQRKDRPRGRLDRPVAPKFQRGQHAGGGLADVIRGVSIIGESMNGVAKWLSNPFGLWSIRLSGVPGRYRRPGPMVCRDGARPSERHLGVFYWPGG